MARRRQDYQAAWIGNPRARVHGYINPPGPTRRLAGAVTVPAAGSPSRARRLIASRGLSRPPRLTAFGPAGAGTVAQASQAGRYNSGVPDRRGRRRRAAYRDTKLNLNYAGPISELAAAARHVRARAN